ncbi:MAG: thioredoxin domain-containing protein [Candidatus Woesearchaeota archaeon]|jgi:protein-disulfide isomerase|nr:thioredoxin domain-containing protein [Candidatus Woesearchaeota archaeon]MDP7506292.1 thioredoxin domain-containing protein [Candidatus Woesearchaeota archaeon]MDP7610505.1 thioredoxin domain-containing protein [Candidatus Woesearchaeota archaeon]|tara:strand:- start:341 stop:1267 length:927 start_codon:yes stop_codon:yes gene_type:complete
MICVIALIVFSVLGIFSATHRKIAIEAFDCVFRRVTFRKCTSNLDQRLKSQITGRLMRKNVRLARIVFKNFEIISWTLLIVFFSSMIYSGYAAYNYAVYGNCYGPESDAFCPLAIFEGETSSGYDGSYTGPVVFPDVDDDPSIGPEDAKVTVIEFGCMMCPYTKEAEPVVQNLLSIYEGRIRFVYRDFPLSKKHADADWYSEAANCALEQDMYWEYREGIFDMQEMCSEKEDHILELRKLAGRLELDMEGFNECVDSRRHKAEVMNDFEDGIKAQLKGTPTFFINDRRITGPKPIRAFTKVIDEELKE